MPSKSKKYFVLIALIGLITACSSAQENETPPQNKDAKEEPATKTPSTSPNTDSKKDDSAVSTRSGGTSESGSGLTKVTGATDSGMVIPGAKPGQCFSRVVIPAQYKNIVEQHMTKPSSEKIVTVPAQYELVEEQILIRPASVRYEEIPPTYETVEEKVLVKPAMKKVKEYPAVYETVEEKIVEREGYSEWKKSEDSNLMCLVQIPPVYKTIKKQVLKTPAIQKEELVPAEYSIFKTQVEKTPASTKKIEIPAEYQTVTTKKLVEPEKQVRIPIPAEYDTSVRRVLVREAVTDWRRVLCENNATPEKVSEIQKGLKTAGYDPGRVDGQADSNTFKALNDFQKAKNLPVDPDKYINIETIKALNVAFE